MNNFNNELLLRLSMFLNENEKAITEDLIKDVMGCGVEELTAYKMLLTSFLDLNDNKYFLNNYLDKMVFKLSPNDYQDNPYYKNIKFKNTKYKDWEIKYSSYDKFEAFIFNDFKYELERLIPQVGYFSEGFKYPAIYYKDRMWMSVTPNEINTIDKAIKSSKGKVLTFGLGLGYFSYMASLKSDVERIDIVEIDKDVINLFQNNILPLFETRNKINIINEDAYKFLDNLSDSNYDYIFIDIYHDASDGVITYNKMESKLKSFTKTKYDFWIYDTLKYYL